MTPLEFLGQLWQYKPEDQYILIWTLPDKRSRWFTGVPEAAQYVASIGGSRDVYVGVGLSAHGYLDGVRFANVRGLQSYMRRVEAGRLPTVSSEIVDVERARSDAAMLGLRLLSGLHLASFDHRFGGSLLDARREPIERLSELGLVEIAAGYLRLTERGYLLANQVWQHFV